jgi:hypothetical protein
MKTISVLALVVSITSIAQAEQFVARQPRAPRVAVAPAGPQMGGGFAHAARTGNALQALNPRAPREYGTGEENVYRDSDDPVAKTRRESRPLGLRLFSIEFW